MKSFFKLIPFLKPQWKLLLGAAIFALPLSAIRFSTAPLLKYMTDSVLVQKDSRALLLVSLAVVGLYLVNVVVRFTHAFLARIANERVMRDIRERLFGHYLNLSSSFFTEASVGKLISRVTNDVFYVSQGTINLINLVRDSVTFTALFIYAFRLSPKLLAIALVIAPMLAWLGKRSGILMKGYAAKMQEANGWVYSALQESFTGFKVVKAFALENFARQRFKERNDQYVMFALKAAKVEEIGGPSVELMGATAMALIIYIGGRDVIQGRLSPGELVSFFSSFLLMINPVRNLNDINMKLNMAAASADRIDETLKLRSEIVELPHAKALMPFQSQIEFRNVSFRYTAELPWVFRNVSFTVTRGQTVAIVGGSGQGKSTMVSLLPRFYDPVEGKIFIDGTEVREVTFESLRSQIALVSQDVFLFNDTIFNNVAAGKRDATQAQVIEALDSAQAMPFIERLPQGLQTLVGDRGQKLSGGERQRISIARAILRDSSILVLDEATSSLDTESEKLVQIALERLMRGRTTLVIAHRLSTIKNADRILVLAGGTIQESGTHDELMRRAGEYAKFYALLA
ncbi:MAG: ABC transporter transmembrane domain-containing protein [Bdellovibrionota bacterium]